MDDDNGGEGGGVGGDRIVGKRALRDGGYWQISVVSELAVWMMIQVVAEGLDLVGGRKRILSQGNVRLGRVGEINGVCCSSNMVSRRWME